MLELNKGASLFLMINHNTSQNKQRFIDNDNGTITDSFTGLMWQEGYAYRETGNYINWYDANDYVEKLNEQKLGEVLRLATSK